LDEITTEMREGDYDLIVIGAHRRAGWQSYLLSDLAQAIIAHADRSVLLLRRG
jgi:nucleotide-binding universal stress UspA family protein